MWIKPVMAAVLLYAAFPPIGWWPLGIVAIGIYASMIVDEQPVGRRGYWILWGTSAATWLGLLQGVRLAYWPLYFGWIALSLYLAVYLPMLVGTARALHHRRGWPLLAAMPAAWITFELIRGYFATGFSGCLLGHTLSKQPLLIQSASQFGTYGVSAIVVVGGVVAFRLFEWLTKKEPLRYRAIETGFGFVVLTVAIAYGLWELQRSHRLDGQKLFTAALIQENGPTVFEANEYRNQRTWENYLAQTRAAAQTPPEIDLVVWPESVFTRNEPLFDWDRSKTLPASLLADNIGWEQLSSIVDGLKRENDNKFQALRFAMEPQAGDNRASFLLGCDVHRIHGDRHDRLNAAIWVSPDGQLVDYYAKQHLVMFGEYIPLGDWLPFIYQAIGMQPAAAGDGPKALRLKDRAVLVPTICFEDMVPHFLRKQLRHIVNQGQAVDVMVNITNDGWFHGSSISDIHLNNAILAAVENRRPMLIAANVGLTAWIDGSGKIMDIAERLKPAVVMAHPTRDSRWGLWQTVGDWPIRIVALIVAAVCWRRK